MKQKIRTIIQDWNGQYRHCIIQILDEQYPGQTGYLTTIGEIRFQTHREKVAEIGEDKCWYGMSFSVTTDRNELSEFEKMAKLIKWIKEFSEDGFDIQPKDLIVLISGIEHFHFHSHFIPVSYKGTMKHYFVHKISNDEVYCSIYAINQIIAEKELSKRKDIIPSNFYVKFYQDIK